MAMAKMATMATMATMGDDGDDGDKRDRNGRVLFQKQQSTENEKKPLTLFFVVVFNHFQRVHAHRYPPLHSPNPNFNRKNTPSDQYPQ